MPRPIIEDKLLVVEGKDDSLFFTALLKSMKLTGVEVRQLEGKSKYANKIAALAVNPEFKTVKALGLVRDSDQDPEKAFESVRGALQEAGLPIPNACREICTDEDKPRVGVILMPREDESGALEKLLLRSVADEKAYACVDAYFKCLGERGVSVERYESKRRVQVYIASQDCESHIRLPGEAAARGIWPWDSPAFDEVKNFLKTLFREAES